MNKNVIVIAWIFLILLISKLYSQSATNVDADSFRVIRIGYPASALSFVDDRDARVAIEIWSNQLIVNIPLTMRASAYAFPDLSLLVKAINANDIDLVMLTGLDFLRIKNQVSLQPALVGSYGEGFGEQFILLTHNDLSYKELGNFKDKKLIIHTLRDRYDLSRLWLETLFLRSGIFPIENFFKKIDEVPKASRAILGVFFGQADACVVPLRAFKASTELNPQLAEKLKILHQSPIYLDNLVCFQRENYENKI